MARPRKTHLPIFPSQVTFDEKTHQNPEFLIEGLLPEGYLVLLAGLPKQGKTAFATAMALSVASGIPFASSPESSDRQPATSDLRPPASDPRLATSDPRPATSDPRPATSDLRPPTSDLRPPTSDLRPATSDLRPPTSDGLRTHRSPVLWLSLEESQTERNLILSQAPTRIKKALTPHSSFFQSFTAPPLDTPEGAEMLVKEAQEIGAKLVVVDPLHASTSGRSLYDGWGARRSLQELKRITAAHNITVIALHHVIQRNGDLWPAESQQLSCVPGMFMVLGAMPYKGKLPAYVTPVLEPDAPTAADGITGEIWQLELMCRGRGDFANRNWHFFSKGPFNLREYQPLGRETEDTSDFALRPVEEQILKLLKEHPKLSTGEILMALDGAPQSTVKNAVSRLFNRRIVEVAECKNGRRKYVIAENE